MSHSTLQERECLPQDDVTPVSRRPRPVPPRSVLYPLYRTYQHQTDTEQQPTCHTSRRSNTNTVVVSYTNTDAPYQEIPRSARDWTDVRCSRNTGVDGSSYFRKFMMSDINLSRMAVAAVLTGNSYMYRHWRYYK